MRVLNDNVLVAIPKKPERTETGLYLPQNNTDEGQILEGTVIKVGEGKLLSDGKRIPLNVTEGCKIWFPKFNSHKFEIAGTLLYLVNENSIIAVEDEE